MTLFLKFGLSLYLNTLPSKLIVPDKPALSWGTAPGGDGVSELKLELETSSSSFSLS